MMDEKFFCLLDFHFFLVVLCLCCFFVVVVVVVECSAGFFAFVFLSLASENLISRRQSFYSASVLTLLRS